MVNIRFKKLLVRATVSFLVLSLVMVIGISCTVGWKLTHPAREQVVIPAGASGFNPQEVSFTSRQDNVPLRGWFIASGNSNKTIVFSHGYARNRLQEDVPATDIALKLKSEGYNVLMFDYRNCGESGGNLTSVGQYEKNDLIGAVDFIKKTGRPGEHIGVIGFSMGAATALLAAAEDKRIEAVVSDASFADLTNYLTDNLPVWSGLPSLPFTPIILNMMPYVLNLEPGQVSPVKAVPGIKAPVLFIHGSSDPAIPVDNSKELYSASSKGGTLWIVPGAVHVGAYKKQPAEYMKRIISLFQCL